MTGRAATLLRLMRGGRVGKAGQEPTRLKGRKSWCLRKPVAATFRWLLPSLLTLTSVSKPHLGPCMIRVFFMGWGWDIAVWGLLILILTLKRMGYQLPEWRPAQPRKQDSTWPLIHGGSTLWVQWQLFVLFGFCSLETGSH